MTQYSLFDWHDSCPYLGFLIVRLDGRYSIIDPDPNSGHLVWDYETIEQAKEFIEHLYIEHLLFDALQKAAEAGIVDVKTSEDLIWHIGSQVLDKHSNLPLTHVLMELRENNGKKLERLRRSMAEF